MAPPDPPQPPLSFDIDALGLIKEAEDIVASSMGVWNAVAQIAPQDASFHNVILPIARDENIRTNRARPIRFLETVSPSKPHRDAAKEAAGILTRDDTTRWAREDVFSLVVATWERAEPLDPESRRFLEKIREEFILAGHALRDKDSRVHLANLQESLELKKQEYTRNLNADVSGMWLTAEELEGVSESDIQRWKSDGTRWFVDRKHPNIRAVLANGIRSDVRQKAWVGWDNMAKDFNGPLQHDIILLRDQIARTLGYRHHAHHMESSRMLTTDAASTFLEDLRPVIAELAHKELLTLQELKTKHFEELPRLGRDPATRPDKVFLWDRAFYNRLAPQEAFHIDTQTVAEFFPLGQCLERMLPLLSSLFGVTFCKYGDGDISTWHPEVLTYAVWDGDTDINGFLGYLYMDLFPREHKYGHKGHYLLQAVSGNRSAEVPSVFAGVSQLSTRIRQLTSLDVRGTRTATARDIIQALRWLPTTPRPLHPGQASSGTTRCYPVSTSWATLCIISAPGRPSPDFKASTG